MTTAPHLLPSARLATPHRIMVGLRGELSKYVQDYLAEWRSALIQLLIFPAAYLLIVLFIGHGQLRTELLVPILIGFIPLTFLHEQVNRSFWGYLGDIQSGVLEQTYLTSLPSWALIMGRQAGAIAAALPLALFSYLVGVVTVAVKHGTVPFDIQVVVPLAAIALGTVGLALVLSGLTLVFKRIEVITEAAMSLPVIIGGTFVPLADLPNWIAALSRLLVPITPGVEAMRDILLDHRALTTLHTGWGLGWLLAQPILLITLGGLLFHRLQRIALRKGTLGRY